MLDPISFTSSALNVGPAAFGAFCFIPLVFCIYRWRFHPLSKYPGPLLAKFTDLYLVYYAFEGRAQIKLKDLHEVYGPTVRIGPNKLSFDSVDAYYDIYNSKSVQKSQGYHAVNSIKGVSNSLTFIDKVAHRQRRKGLSPAFSENALRSFEPVMIENVDIMLRELQKTTFQESARSGWSAPLNVIERCRYFTLDTMTAFGFGRSFNAQTEVSNRGILKGMETTTMVSVMYQQYPTLGHFKAGIERLMQSSKGTREHFASLMRQIVKSRLAEAQTAKQDMFSLLMGSKEHGAGEGLTMNELWMESRLLMVAGTDTTASVLAATLFYLSRYPACYERLVSEIRGAFSSGDEIRHGPKLTESLYLRAVINEAMRLSPPVGMALWRETTEDTVIAGEPVPKGTDVGAAMYGIFHDERYFPRAQEYVPDRWLASDPQWKDQLNIAQRAFHPFSLGARKCIGQTMAYSELTLALAKLVWYFDFRCPSEPLKSVGSMPITQKDGTALEEYKITEFVTPLPDGPYLEFRYRGDSDKEI